MSNYYQDIDDIRTVHNHWNDFWGNGGWARGDAANLLAQSHLDWLVSLVDCLAIWARDDKATELSAGALILAWTNLGSLFEGSMKFFLSVYKSDYDKSPVVGRKQKPLDPDVLMLDGLRQFFSRHVWTNSQKKQWNKVLEKIRDHRNAIHAYRHRDLGTFPEFGETVHHYLCFILELENQIPYPDEQYAYPVEISQISERVLYGNH